MRRSPLHFRRIELKYFVPERNFQHLAERLAPFTEVDPYLLRQGGTEIAYPVTSLYFDSWDLHAFQEKFEGNHFRRKIRLRTYHDEYAPQDPYYLEIKRRLDHVIVKDRLKIPPGTVHEGVHITGLLRHLLRHLPQDDTRDEATMMASWFNLQPTVLVRYQRSSRVAKEDRTMRITLDHHIEGSWKPPRLLGPQIMRSVDNINAAGATGIAGKYAMLEIKTNRTIPPGIHQVIRDLELVRTDFSKYFWMGWTLRPEIFEDCGDEFEMVGVA